MTAYRCAGGCGDLVREPGEWCFRCWDAEQDRRHPDVLEEAENRRDYDADERLNYEREAEV